MSSRIYKSLGLASINVGIDFLEDAVTSQSIMEDIISPHQFVKIIEIENENGNISFQCEVYEYLMN